MKTFKDIKIPVCYIEGEKGTLKEGTVRLDIEGMKSDFESKIEELEITINKK